VRSYVRSYDGKGAVNIDQVGEPRVCLSFDDASEERSDDTEFVAVSLEVKIKERIDSDGPLVAHVRCSGGKLVVGRALEKRAQAGWLVYRIPRCLCSEGESLRFRALVDKDVIWQTAYRVVWRGGYPGLIATG